MKTTLALISILMAALSTQAQTTNLARPKVAVIAFENLTSSRERLTIGNPALTPSRLPILSSDSAGYFKIDMGHEIERFGETARSLLEAALVRRPEIEVVERKRVELIQRELDLNRARGGRRYVDEQEAKSRGADFLVIGEILGGWSETTEYQGYGLNLKTEATTAHIGLRVVKLASETVVFSFERTGTIYKYSTPSFRITNDSPMETAIRLAIREMAGDPHFIEAFVEKVRREGVPVMSTVEACEVPFTTEGASIEIDGRYVGTGPLRRFLNPDIEYRVRLTKPGFVPWEGRISPKYKLVVGPALEPLPSTPSAATNSTIK